MKDPWKLFQLLIKNSMVTLQNVGFHFEQWETGILGPVFLNGLDNGKKDLTWQKWSYQVRQLFPLPLHFEYFSCAFILCCDIQVGLKGEAANLVTPEGAASVDWVRGSLAVQHVQPLTWFKVRKNQDIVRENKFLDYL